MSKKKVAPFVLALMPFGESFRGAYEHGIKPACAALGMHCERVDEQRFDGLILNRIYAEIARADVVVCDLSGASSNVFYETGYAHALGKRVVLLIDDARNIPFDLNQYQHIVYGTSAALLKSKLEGTLATFAGSNQLLPRLSEDTPATRMSPSTAERQLSAGIPREWGSRSMYLGLGGARNWLAVVHAPQYHRASYAREVLSDVVASDFLKRVNVTSLVSLGVGDGAIDRILCGHLGRSNRLSYVPVDINPYLVSKAIKSVSPVAAVAGSIVCDFEDEMLGYLKPELDKIRQGARLFSMLGYTLCNVDDTEAKFFWNLQALMQPGDYLLLDYVAAGSGWNFSEYAQRWHGEWDQTMRKLVCDGYAKRSAEAAPDLAHAFERRFTFCERPSDVPAARATYIADAVTGEVVTNVRRYSGLGAWLRNSFEFDLIKEETTLGEHDAGRGYLLVRKSR